MGKLIPELIEGIQSRFFMMSDYLMLTAKIFEAGTTFFFPAILRKTRAKLAKMGPHHVVF